MAYTYEKQLWKDYPDTTTPITADRLNHMEEGIEKAAKTGGGESDKVGVIKLFGGSNAPEGWLLCDGSAVSRTTYSDLFKAIGTAYGEGDGSTTFNLPDMRGKVGVGLAPADTYFNTLGKTGGEKTHTLTIDELPSHTHNLTYNTSGAGANTGGTVALGNTSTTSPLATLPTGGSKEHNNLQPYIVLNYIIKASASTSIQAEVIDSLDGNSTTNAPSVRAVNDGLLSKYTAEEQKIGIYLNKGLYRKTVEFTACSSINTWTAVPGMENIDTCIKYYGYAKPREDELWIIPNNSDVPYFSVGTETHRIREAHRDASYNSKICSITFEYTKITES